MAKALAVLVAFLGDVCYGIRQVISDIDNGMYL